MKLFFVSGFAEQEKLRDEKPCWSTLSLNRNFPIVPQVSLTL